MAGNNYYAAIILLIVVVALNASVCCKANSFLVSGEGLRSGESLRNGDYALTMQPNCNLVLSQGTKTIWASNTNGRSCTCTMQSDRNFVIHASTGNAIWASNTWSNTRGNYIIALQKNGNLVIFGNAVWGVPGRNDIINANETGSIINMVTSTGV